MQEPKCGDPDLLDKTCNARTVSPWKLKIRPQTRQQIGKQIGGVFGIFGQILGSLMVQTCSKL